MEHTEQPTRAFPEVPWFSEAWEQLPETPLGVRWFGDMWKLTRDEKGRA